MYRLFPCTPIFWGFFLLKVQKECVYVIMLKIALVLVEIYVLVGKKGISELSRWVAQKHTAVEIIQIVQIQQARAIFMTDFKKLKELPGNEKFYSSLTDKKN